LPKHKAPAAPIEKPVTPTGVFFGFIQINISFYPIPKPGVKTLEDKTICFFLTKEFCRTCRVFRLDTLSGKLEGDHDKSPGPFFLWIQGPDRSQDVSFPRSGKNCIRRLPERKKKKMPVSPHRNDPGRYVVIPAGESDLLAGRNGVEHRVSGPHLPALLSRFDQGIILFSHPNALHCVGPKKNGPTGSRGLDTSVPISARDHPQQAGEW